ncbi:MAG: N-acetylneuraminate synthase family protein [Desulfobacter sp.]|nr:MAG: N-acetylneuraminate synthase family protein [Desulfobacter sp.]
MVCFGKRRLGPGEPCFITFEAGATHDGEETATALIREAARAGADAVKFQIFDPDRLVADKEQLFSYEVLADRGTGRTERVEETLYDILCRRCLSREEWRRVKAVSDELGLAFFATAGFEADIRLLEELGCDSVKIASADINHWPLIRRAARTGMAIQLDTGNASLGEVEQAVDICLAEGNANIIVHNCPSGYPARLESINLRLIPTLLQMFPELAVAYSDHTPGWEMDVAALAMGAHLLEKTITLDRTLRSPEHVFSLEPHDMAGFIEAIRRVETAMGSPRRVLHAHEKKMRMKVRRSAFLRTAVKKGERVCPENVEFRRPGTGISPDRFEGCWGMVFGTDLPAGHCLTPGDMRS